MKGRIATVVLALMPLLILLPGQTQESDVNLHTLCSHFPDNSRCQGYEAPVALDKRFGMKGKCLLVTDRTEQKGACKVTISANELSVFIEEGEPLELLEGEQATRKISIPYGQIVSLDGLKYDQLFGSGGGLLGLLFEAAVGEHGSWSEIEVGYLNQEPSGEEVLSYATLILKQTDGEVVHSQLETSTQSYSEVELIAFLKAKGISVGNPEHLEQLRTNNTCIKCDLRGAQLAGTILREANLKGSNLRGANLAGADLAGANLKGCNLKGAVLEGVNLQGANLTPKRKTPTIFNHAILKHADLSNAKLNGASLVRADLEQANLADVDGTRAVIEGWGGKRYIYTTFREANLREANLQGADMDRVILDDANLSGANLRDADLDRAHLAGANLDRANLLGASLKKVELDSASLCGCTMVDGSESSQGCH